MTIEQEFYNQLLPLGNTPATRGMIQVPVFPTGGVLNLDTALGPTGGGGHFFELKAMQVPSGHAVHIALSPQPTYTIGFGNMATGGVYTGVGWPLTHGESVKGRIPYVGYEPAPTLAGYTLTGYRATLAPAAYLHYRATAGMPTGAVLHVRPMTIIPGSKAGDADGFPIPGR